MRRIGGDFSFGSGLGSFDIMLNYIIEQHCSVVYIGNVLARAMQRANVRPKLCVGPQHDEKRR